MILLDTNVISEVMRPQPSSRVIQWLDGQSRGSVGTTAISLGEILHGIERLPKGRRRTDLEMRFRTFLDRGLERRVAEFNELAAHAYARILVDRDSIGRPIAKLDAMIASIALSLGADVATRDIADFERCGVTVLNPWE